MFSVLEMVTPDTYTRIARHSIDGWTVLLKLYWAITPSPSPQLYFPVFITRGRKQSTTELEPLGLFAEWTSDTYTRIAMHSIFIGPESDHWLCLSLTNSLTSSGKICS